MMLRFVTVVTELRNIFNGSIDECGDSAWTSRQNISINFSVSLEIVLKDWFVAEIHAIQYNKLVNCW